MKILCLVDRKIISSSFPVKVASDDTVADVKKLIKTEKVAQLRILALLPSSSRSKATLSQLSKGYSKYLRADFYRDTTY
ncbi:hypothetical protein BG015_001686 [Linnemannia schmuckeri]|uniref:Crinkler effector protein N-terminal domain-containing protein n=1 Tax=Linnemannia schmuckeri TaxID=64567 RepID=A0A9P5VDV9_9FUNG|nr:hypothetical protein BG015_001686 [Linnemannia schmuckeri]